MLLYLINSPRALLNNILGSIFLFLIFILVWKFSQKGFGWGDIHYSLYCGLISGFPGFIFSGLIASFIGLVIFLFIKVFLVKKNIKKQKIPFIPIMFAGTICELLFSDYFMALI
jgi:prepilin signal peptidase PulO-like enzyme (type II secretory pathway)